MDAILPLSFIIFRRCALNDIARDPLLEAAINEDISIHPYDPDWPVKFLQEKARLLSIFSHDLLEIEHIGSTAVPGIAAKPIIDLMAAVRTMSAADCLLVPLRDFGYATPPECNAALVDRRWLMRHSWGHRTHHLHLVELSSEGWRRTIRFRDILRSHADIAKAYEELKFRLAASAGSNRAGYILGKSEFVEDALRKWP